MDTNYLKQMIHDEAVGKFSNKWEISFPDNEEARQNYQKLLQTEEFKEFKNTMIKIYEKEITSNVLHSFEGVRRIVKQVKNNASI
ncbi:hypothetical protein [Lactobacillus phage P185]|nr:hypothetical protein [Lactobacillus phage P185]